MSSGDVIHESEPFILVEGPKWGNAKFYGKWLLAAARADALWKKAIKAPSFEKKIERLLVVYMPDFGIGAIVLLSQVEKNFATFLVRLNSELEVELFTMMVDMGFFVLTGQRYQMVIPTDLSMEKVKTATLKYAQTEDEKCVLHPEHLVTTMPYVEAQAWQMRLRAFDEKCRCADRLLLLEASSDLASKAALDGRYSPII